MLPVCGPDTAPGLLVFANHLAEPLPFLGSRSFASTVRPWIHDPSPRWNFPKDATGAGRAGGAGAGGAGSGGSGNAGKVSAGIPDHSS